MKRFVSCIIILSLLVQIGCSGITQIPYPTDERKSEKEIRQLNYFGDRLSSTIQLTNSIEIEAYWLNMRGDKIYFLTNGLDDTSFVSINKLRSVRFYDAYGGCMKGGWLGLGLTLVEGFILWGLSSRSNTGHPGSGIALLVVGPATILLSTFYGIFFMGQREFNFAQNK